MNDASIMVNDEELDRFEQAVNAYLNLEMDADRFLSMRLQQGVYGQRQEGVHMVRCKIPGGELTGDQLAAIADVMAANTEHPLAHVTTRQDIQLHHVPTANTPRALRALARAGITTREACNNTIRNITMQPLAGVCPGELVDIAPFKDACVQYLIRNPLTQYMPRKFKISFSGCETDPAQGMVHDIGVVPARRGNQFGFKILAGGGLGHKPYEAIVVEDFLPEELLLPAIEALVSLHHKYSDRTKRAKSRSKFLVTKFTPEGFTAKYKEEFAHTRETFSGPVVHGEWHRHTGQCICGTGAPRKVTPQKQPGLVIVPVSLPIGDMTAPQMHGIRDLMQKHGLTRLRTTQDQNLVFLDVPFGEVDAIVADVEALGLGLPQAGDDVVACPGTSTCRLGITGSRKAAARLSGGPLDLKIRVSGCQNGCAQPEVADIGIYGQGKRLHGKLVPHYQMYFGGDGRTGYGIAVKGPEVPVARVEDAVARVEEAYAEGHEEDETFFAWTRRMGQDFFKELLADLTTVTLDELPAVLRDFDDEGDFKVLQLGGGECAGSAHNPVATNFAEAAYERVCRNSLVYQRQFDGALECNEAMARLIGEAIANLYSGKKEVKAESIEQVQGLIAEQHPELAARLGQIAAQQAALVAEFESQAFTDVCRVVDAFMDDAARVAVSIDPQLDLSSSMTEKVLTAAWAEAKVVDLTATDSDAFAELALEELDKLAAGDELHILVKGHDVPATVASHLTDHGHDILGLEDQDGKTLVKVRKAATRETA